MVDFLAFGSILLGSCGWTSLLVSMDVGFLGRSWHNLQILIDFVHHHRVHLDRVKVLISKTDSDAVDDAPCRRGFEALALVHAASEHHEVEPCDEAGSADPRPENPHPRRSRR